MQAAHEAPRTLRTCQNPLAHLQLPPITHPCPCSLPVLLQASLPCPCSLACDFSRHPLPCPLLPACASLGISLPLPLLYAFTSPRHSGSHDGGTRKRRRSSFAAYGRSERARVLGLRPPRPWHSPGVPSGPGAQPVPPAAASALGASPLGPIICSAGAAAAAAAAAAVPGALSLGASALRAAGGLTGSLVGGQGSGSGSLSQCCTRRWGGGKGLFRAGCAHRCAAGLALAALACQLWGCQGWETRGWRPNLGWGTGSSWAAAGGGHGARGRGCRGRGRCSQLLMQGAGARAFLLRQWWFPAGAVAECPGAGGGGLRPARL